MITYAYEPHRLILTWQPRQHDDSRPTSTRGKLAIAELLHIHNNVVFRYLKNTPDFIEALNSGFIGYPAFHLFQEIHTIGVLDAFLRRLPPRSRSDFNLYLQHFGLNPDFKASEFSLLGYTGARLPSDPFELFMDLDVAHTPVDFLLEIAGFRYTQPNVDTQNVINLPLHFQPEPENIFDPSAIAVYQDQYKIGYVSRVLCSSFQKLFSRGTVSAKICKLNGSRGNTTAFMLVSLR
ncbi:HIRAN domain-containing protein [uncultured Pseudomonas sp.]|uniref:HIRAN domain-containing protein n=1 Tax=uncultured Pseudomonas sp. TaxID=114707 RepID=UPI0025978A62|nr:HIRAN domain-containing protein [uncultured Pseudomonas sp.]